MFYESRLESRYSNLASRVHYQKNTSCGHAIEVMAVYGAKCGTFKFPGQSGGWHVSELVLNSLAFGGWQHLQEEWYCEYPAGFVTAALSSNFFQRLHHRRIGSCYGQEMSSTPSPRCPRLPGNRLARIPRCQRPCRKIIGLEDTAPLWEPIFYRLVSRYLPC